MISVKLTTSLLAMRQLIEALHGYEIAEKAYEVSPGADYKIIDPNDVSVK